AFRAVSRGVAGVFGVPVRGDAAPAFKVAAGRIFLDVTAALQNTKTRALILNGSGALDQQMPTLLRSLVERDRQIVAPPGPSPSRPRVRFLLRRLGQFVGAALRPDAARARILDRIEARVRALEKRADALRSLAERRRFVEEVLPPLLPEILSQFLALVGCAWLSLARLRARLRDWLGDDTALQAVLRALPHNPTTEMGLAL